MMSRRQGALTFQKHVGWIKYVLFKEKYLSIYYIKNESYDI